MERKKARWRREFAASAETGSISPVVRSVMKLIAEHRALPRRRHDVELALREALANAIVHGSHKDPGKQVHVAVSGDREGIRIMVRDEGPGFDYRRPPDPLEAERIHAHHGRGIFLIRRLMDQVRFAQGGREIRMWKEEKRRSRKR